MCFEGGDVSKGAWSRQLEEAKRDSINTGGRLQATDNRSSLMVTKMAQKYGRELLQLRGLIDIILNYHMQSRCWKTSVVPKSNIWYFWNNLHVQKKNPGSIIIARNITSSFCISTDLTWVIYQEGNDAAVFDENDQPTESQIQRDLENQSDQMMQQASPLCLNSIVVTQNITEQFVLLPCADIYA